MTFNSRLDWISVAAAAATMAGSGAAHAQAQPAAGAASPRAELEEIVVTASKREEPLQLVPQTIVAVSESTIRDLGAQDFSGLLNSMSGVEMRNTQAGLGGVTIRGVAELNMGNLYGGSGSAAGLYLDEIPLTSAGIFPDISSFDLARVEVLKGPQGTLFGEGSLAGTVRLISNAPDPSGSAAAADLTYSSTEDGEDNQVYNGMVNIPLGDKAAVRAVGYRKDMGGFIDARILSTGEIEEDMNDDTLSGGRLSFRYMPSDRLTLDVSAMINNAERGNRNRATEDLIGTFSVPESTNDDLDAYNGTLTYRFDAADLVVTTSYFDRSVDAVIDQAGLVGGVNFVFDLIGIPIDVAGVYIDQDISAETFAAEARLVSTRPGPLQWTAGLFYKDLQNEFSLISDGVPSIPSQVWVAISNAITGGQLSIEEGYFTESEGSNEQLAAFGEVTWDFTDAWTLVAGGRFFKEERESTTNYGGVFPLLQGGPPPGQSRSEGDDTVFNPRLSLRFRMSDAVMSYGTISRGFRGGGQNDLWTLVPGGTEDYDPEYLTNYELGLKSTWQEGRLVFNAAAFYLDWEDLQAVTAEGTGGIGETIGNIGNAHSVGVDMELRALVLDGLELALAATVLEAEIDDDVLVPDPAGGASLTVPDGTRIPKTAETTLSLGATYRMDITDGLGAFFRGTASYVGDSIASLTRPDDVVPSRTVLDLRAGIEGERWQAYVFADNVTNEEIYYYQVDFPDLATGEDQYFVGRPRTIGVNVRVRY
jgi:outer membrane receptor protein involved in Fe transport